MSTQFPHKFQIAQEVPVSGTTLQPISHKLQDQDPFNHQYSQEIAYARDSGHSLASNQNLYVASTVSLGLGLLLMIGSLWAFVRTWNWFRKDKVSKLPANSYLNAFKSVPCYNCIYFSDNLYIKCAVHPESVLTQSAHHCQDYCSRSEQVDQIR